MNTIDYSTENREIPFSYRITIHQIWENLREKYENNSEINTAEAEDVNKIPLDE